MTNPTIVTPVIPSFETIRAFVATSIKCLIIQANDEYDEYRKIDLEAPEIDPHDVMDSIIDNVDLVKCSKNMDELAKNVESMVECGYILPLNFAEEMIDNARSAKYLATLPTSGSNLENW